MVGLRDSKVSELGTTPLAMHKVVIRQSDNHIDVGLVKKFYANLYDP